MHQTLGPPTRSFTPPQGLYYRVGLSECLSSFFCFFFPLLTAFLNSVDHVTSIKSPNRAVILCKTVYLPGLLFCASIPVMPDAQHTPRYVHTTYTVVPTSRTNSAGSILRVRRSVSLSTIAQMMYPFAHHLENQWRITWSELALLAAFYALVTS
ncbi:hypothetical protein GDO78_018136 [Eleutherodactylus coqui]|uniref:Uncharacterized protein n=1 Tax=Eleutherodactylus coqui TaxID=57060 RepID=A0A8J6BER0_ELECQ|nr:hypothetical protein GDO78_018136 [Eleutherodactylus coqui]